MATGTVFFGADALVSVAPNTGDEVTPVAGTYVPVSDMNSIGKTTQRNNSTFPVFGRALAHVVPGARDQTYALGGFVSLADDGQEALNAAEAADDTIFIKVLYNGTDGFSQLIRVGTHTYSATPDGLQLRTYALNGVADAVIIGLGPLL